MDGPREYCEMLDRERQILCVTTYTWNSENKQMNITKNSGPPWWLSGKESTCQWRIRGLDLWIGKIPWRRKWHPTPVFLPGKSHGWRSRAGCSPWGHKRAGHGWTTEHAGNRSWAPRPLSASPSVPQTPATGFCVCSFFNQECSSLHFHKTPFLPQSLHLSA